MRRRHFLFLLGGGLLLPLKTTPAWPICNSVFVLDAPLELGGKWGGSAPSDAAAVIERMRTACLAGVALVSDRQPDRLRVDNHAGTLPSIWLHTQPPRTGWIIVSIGTRDWCKLAYQFGHELGHVLCNSWQSDAKPQTPCQWIEEALVEAFSLRGLGLLADAWEHAPPFPRDAAFADAIRDYREKMVVNYRAASKEQDETASLRNWFNQHEASLHVNGGVKAAAGAVSTMLDLLQSDATMVADLGALNRWPGRSGVPLHHYLNLWEKSCAELKAPGRLPVRLRNLLAQQ
ncbi:hypothetical protein T281_15440 [Rhodomicrobium udaipurense JA643]|uniref:Uncharacterized protein n=1 Tax=Rhodomicrobium udaipurense TaxID=1202716 RepID=A0A8I1GG19_9HYPH|nr:hypothetical protein [Rhodomicrobium udaipurense]KAI93642.1 hypothetical protein T281_15440 [Rhodomicrobium udaipurense JA643]MBJ7544013.1 hypothetical protein [Rhodomicrobium udaipurense]